jgi:transposase
VRDKLADTPGLSVTRGCRLVGERLGINPDTLRNWVKQARIDTGEAAGTTSEDAKRIAVLEKKNRELRRANTILCMRVRISRRWCRCRVNTDPPLPGGFDRQRGVSLRPASTPHAPPVLGEPSITPGTVLTGATIMALCRTRDLGVAAATGDATNPPDILREIDPSRWPQTVVEG